MGASDLFTGIAIVIDDEIGKKNANINKIMKQIKNRHMPYVIYKTLPPTDIIRHFNNMSFLLLDWKLKPEALAASVLEGVKSPSVISKSAVNDNIAFLKKIKETCFAPIFIFTNEDKEVVIGKLKENSLYSDVNPNFIFVKNKSELIGGKKLFKEIDTWAKKVLSIYILKEWEREYRLAKNRLFKDFYQHSPSWPKILWDTFRADGVNMSHELGEVITRNLYSRMAPFSFDDKVFKKRKLQTSQGELRRVLEGERFIKDAGLHHDSISCGDVFKMPGQEYYLNIRPDCDCIQDRGNATATIDDVKLYLLKGNKISGQKERKSYNKDCGNFNEFDNQAIVFSMLDGKTYNFQFKNIVIMKWSELKSRRIGRILPPYITRIQQRYAMYLQRQGLPRTPKDAIPSKSAKPVG